MEEISYPSLLWQILQGSQAFIKFPFEFSFVGLLSFFFMFIIGCLVAEKAQEMSVNQKEIGFLSLVGG